MAIKNNRENKTGNILLTAEASGEKAFFMMNGKVVTRLVDLPDNIENSDDQTFSYHVNDQKNDFASWISNVFNAKQLARKISMIKNKGEMVSVLKSQLR